jgi:hypothetical protein
MVFGVHMLNRLTFLLTTLAIPATFLVFATSVIAKDYFLTIGGGYETSANQLSLERNVIFQQSVLAAQRPDRPSYDVWFADGNDPHPDVQCRDPKFEENCPLARRLLAELLGDADSADLVYRNNEVPNLAGPADLKQVKQHFADLASQVKSGDRVIIYVAGHGGKARRRGRRDNQSKPNPYNTTFYFWNNEQVTASDFASWLDRFPKDAQVVLVMVQCYAGGFAHTIFDHADASAGLSDHARCGFFAQLYDRSAAGCTPDANEADFEEYSGCFWGALAGKSRDGKVITDADYDKNGQVSFAEAHSYAVIQSDTIDVPVRTSEALLKQYSKIGDAPTKSKSPAKKEKDGDATNTEPELLGLSGPVKTLAANCRPEQRAVIEQLTAKLGLKASATVEDVQAKLRQAEDKLDTATSKSNTATRTRRSALKDVRNEIYDNWPELQSEWAPLAVDLATDRADEFVSRVQKLPDYATLGYAKKREEELIKTSMQLERDKARVERLLRACETAVLAANLSKIAKPEIVRRYEELLRMEEGTLADSSHVNSPSAAGGN